MTTYTIAFWNDLLIATIPDDGDLDAAVKAESERASIPEMEATSVETGLILTDETEDGDEIVYSDTRTGWLIDENGKTYRYAVKRKS